MDRIPSTVRVAVDGAASGQVLAFLLRAGRNGEKLQEVAA